MLVSILLICTLILGLEVKDMKAGRDTFTFVFAENGHNLLIMLFTIDTLESVDQVYLIILHTYMMSLSDQHRFCLQWMEYICRRKAERKFSSAFSEARGEMDE